jgi:5,10-methylenetetrahydromethanopterin reductase
MARPLELWTVRLGLPGTVGGLARRLESEGWNGLALGDSQNLAADPYVELFAAVGATSHLQLGTAVTNPVTRHPAVTAAAIATLQAESGGRVSLGIGRGDSALSHIGLAPAPVTIFARYLERLQGYLRGEEVPFDMEADALGGLRGVESLGLADRPKGSRLQWLPAGTPKVPVDVTASGPRMIAIGATLGDRVTFAVGADPERVRWAVDVARGSRGEAGLVPDELPMAVFVPVAVHPDRARARYLTSGAVGSVARFSVMHGKVVGPADETRRRALEGVHRSYDMTHHFTHGASQTAALSDDLIDAFSIAGPPSYCIDRLLELAEIGISRVVVAPGAAATGPDRDELRLARRRLVEEVMPALG